MQKQSAVSEKLSDLCGSKMEVAPLVQDSSRAGHIPTLRNKQEVTEDPLVRDPVWRWDFVLEEHLQASTDLGFMAEWFDGSLLLCTLG